MILSALFQPFYRLVWSPSHGISDAEKSGSASEGSGLPVGVPRGTRPSTATRSIHMNNSDELLTTPRGDTTTPSDHWGNSRNGPMNHVTFTEPISFQNSTETNRILPLISSIFVPFSILLAIPGITEHWYIRTDDQHHIIAFEANTMLLQVTVGISMGCAILANLCLLIRLVGKMVRATTIVCIVALTVHDILSIIIIIIFSVKTQTDDGFILGQAFWTTLCSTISSLVTNATLILDYFMTSNFGNSGSGLTEKQRSLTIIIIILLCYVAFGAAVNTALLDLSYIDALYFSVVCIETVGFGDIDPQTAGSRAFAAIYTTFGILILAVAIGLIREALLEAIQINLYSYIRRERKRRISRRWLGAIKWRLENARLPVWIPVEENSEADEEQWPREMEIGNGRWRRLWWKGSHLASACIPHRGNNDEEVLVQLRPNGASGRMRLNLGALTDAQLRAAAMEAGAPLQKLLPPHSHHHGHHGHQEHDDRVFNVAPSSATPTHHRVGQMISVLGNFAFAVGIGQDISMRNQVESPQCPMPWPRDYGDTNLGSESSMLLDLERAERRMFGARVSIALLLFSTFWLVGSAIFMVMEKWSFGLALYFCFMTFTTVGFGDPAPRTPAGRSFFVGWALLGVGTMTILISFLADRYSDRYKEIIRAAESTLTADEGARSNETRSSSTPGPLLSNRGVLSGRGAVEGGSMATGDEEKETFLSENMLARVDTLKSLIVDEGAHGSRMHLHSLETELNTMLSLIRRARNRAEARVVLK